MSADCDVRLHGYDEAVYIGCETHRGWLGPRVSTVAEAWQAEQRHRGQVVHTGDDSAAVAGTLVRGER